MFRTQKSLSYLCPDVVSGRLSRFYGKCVDFSKTDYWSHRPEAAGSLRDPPWVALSGTLGRSGEGKPGGLLGDHHRALETSPVRAVGTVVPCEPPKSCCPCGHLPFLMYNAPNLRQSETSSHHTASGSSPAPPRSMSQARVYSVERESAGRMSSGFPGPLAVSGQPQAVGLLPPESNQVHFVSWVTARPGCSRLHFQISWSSLQS